MRILHVVATEQRRGAEVFASDLVGALDGVDQRVAVIRKTDGPGVAFAAPVELLGANGGRGPVSMRAVRALRALVRSWRPDVVQAHGGEALTYALAARRRGSAVVYRRIGSASGYTEGRFARAASAQLIRRATITVAVADEVRRQTMQTYGVRASHIVTIPNAVDSARLRPTAGRAEARLALDVPSDARVILSLGAFTWEKDPLGLLAVAEEAMRDRADVICLLAGDGPLRGDVARRADHPSLAGRVRLLGSRTDVPDLLVAADVVLLASATEGMPAVLIEAGMAGVPVASYDIGGISEIVDDGETGVLSPAGDIRALAGRLGELLDDEAARARMGAAARARCLGSFDVGVVAAKYRSLYEDVVSR